MMAHFKLSPRPSVENVWRWKDYGKI